MLQSMAKKIEAEGEKEKELFDKYMCYCKTSGSTLQESIKAAETKAPQVQAALEEAKSSKEQLQADIKAAQMSRSDAESALAEGGALREKEATEYSKEVADYKANIAALEGAIAALEKGMAGSFLQSTSAKVLRSVVANTETLVGSDRDLVMAFLQGSTMDGYAPQSGEIVGILKQIKESMEKEVAGIMSEEEKAKANAEEMIAAKNKEIVASTRAIEEKSGRLGNLGVEIVEMENDLEDTSSSLEEDNKFLADMEANCGSKDKEWAEISKVRTEELLAISETIKILNDDDALELFKKTLPSPSLLQVVATSRQMRSKALEMVKGLQAQRSVSDRPSLDLLAMSLGSNKMNFDAVFKLIDELVATLAKEQTDDDNKKEYCDKTLDSTEDKKKGLDTEIKNLVLTMEDYEGSLATLSEEIHSLTGSIAALDKAVAESTEARKEEHEAYTELMASDSAAKELIGIAKNRLQKFYNPKLHKAAPAPVLSEADTITSNFGGALPPTPAPGGIANTGVMALIQLHSNNKDTVAPPPAPESFGPYAKKGEESNGVMAMMDMLAADLEKEMTEAEVDEKNSQAEYETLTADAKEKRAMDAKSVTDKEAAKAAVQEDLEKTKEGKAATEKELSATEEFFSNLHNECDWLLKNFDLRKAARAGEVDSLQGAKAVLSGADYSLVQSRRSIRRV